MRVLFLCFGLLLKDSASEPFIFMTSHPYFADLSANSSVFRRLNTFKAPVPQEFSDFSEISFRVSFPNHKR